MNRRNSSPRRYAVAAVLLVALVCAISAFRAAGRWLVREDPLSHSDVIFVLSGSMPYRAEEAAKVFREGYAAEVWLSRPESPDAELEALGIHYKSEEEYNKEVLIRGGVPEAAIRILPDEIVNTEQELEEARREMQQEGKSSILVVTSPQHTRRARAIWRILFGRNALATFHAAHEDPFDADRWWRDTRDALSVTREYLGLLNAWAGLPVRPHSP